MQLITVCYFFITLWEVEYP